MRDTDWFVELAKKAPIFAGGMVIFLIGPTGKVPGFDLPVPELVWRIICALIGVFFMASQVVLFLNSQRLGGSPLPISEKAQNVLEKITLLSSPSQITELIARPDGLELNFEDFGNNSKSRRRLLSFDALRDALLNRQIIVTAQSTKSNSFGRVTIGPLQKWLYQKERHPNALTPQNDIITLVKRILNQK
jgi:hypothetical protein